MQQPSKLIGVLAAALLTFGCAAQATSETSASADPVAQAEEALKKAGQAHYEWRDSAKILSKAKEAAAAGDHATAKKLAERVMFEAQRAIAQAKRQETEWQNRVPR